MHEDLYLSMQFSTYGETSIEVEVNTEMIVYSWYWII